MPRAQSTSHRKNPELHAQPLDDLLQGQLRWLDQMMGLQTTWLTSCMALQAECWHNWSAGAQQLPAWMIWHNGTEQLG